MQQRCSERVHTKKLAISDQAEVCPDVDSSFVFSTGKHCHCCSGNKTKVAIDILIWKWKHWKCFSIQKLCWLHYIVYFKNRFIIWLVPWMNKMKKSYIVIGFPSGQDGASIPTRDYPPCPTRKISWKPYNKSFIDQACFVKMAGYWSHFFLQVDGPWLRLGR